MKLADILDILNKLAELDPQAVKKFIADFDEDKSVEPIEFEL